jgi:hypothetical protein
MHMAMVLVPLEFFIDENYEMQLASVQEISFNKNVLLVSEQTSDTWINVLKFFFNEENKIKNNNSIIKYHNIMYFLDDYEIDGKTYLSFITGNDENGFLHLFFNKMSIDARDFYQYSDQVLKTKSIIIKRLTDGDWCIEYDDNVSVDTHNHLVYFTAYKNPLESHL